MIDSVICITGGANVDLAKSIHPDQVVKAVNFILSLDSKTTVFSLTIKSL